MSGVHEAGHPIPSHGLEARMEALEHANRRLSARVNRMENTMATQADVDALTAGLTQAVAGIQAEIASLQAANPTLDLSGLTAEVAAVEALVPAPAAPPADQPPAAG